MDDRLAIEDVRLAAQDREKAVRLRLARSGEDRPEALRPELAERDERAELSAGAFVELRDCAAEWRIAHDRDDEDVGSHIPGLCRGNSKLHRDLDPPMTPALGPRGEWGECT